MVVGYVLSKLQDLVMLCASILYILSKLTKPYGMQ